MADEKETGNEFKSSFSFWSSFSCNVISSKVFYFHYRVTFALLMSFSGLVTAKQYLVKPISCTSAGDLSSDLMEEYCWMERTYRVEEAWQKDAAKGTPNPGVDQCVDGEKGVHHAYYQWVSYILLLQAILFCLPYYIWVSIEGGHFRNLLRHPFIQNKWETNTRRFLKDMRRHSVYFYCYALAELLNLVNVIGQMFLMDRFLGGEFSSYGVQVLQFTEWDWSDRFLEVFPRITKCTFHRTGPSGDSQEHDATCVLPVNVTSEKIYILLWLWFIFLTVLSTLMVIYLVLVMLSPSLRYHILRFRSGSPHSGVLEMFSSRSRLGHWFVLNLLYKNAHSADFRALIKDLNRYISSTEPERQLRHIKDEFVDCHSDEKWGKMMTDF